MHPDPIIYDEYLAVVTRLDELGLELETLVNALQQGDWHAAQCTDNDPAGVAGYLFWAKGTRSLRESLMPRGWIRDNTENYARVVSPNGVTAIAIAAGDGDTGIRSGHPSTRSDKGPATRSAIEHNNQMTFAEYRDPERWNDLLNVRGVDARFAQTRLLLYTRDETTGELRAELSLPDQMVGNKVTGWRERIILPSLPLNPAGMIALDDLGPDGDERIDVPVQRLANGE